MNRSPQMVAQIGVAALVVLMLTSVNVHAQQPRNVRAQQPKKWAFLQDVRMLIPKSNRAYVSATRELSVRLDLLAELEEPSDTLVTLVRPSGETEEFTPNEESLVALQNVEAGPHVLVASSRQAHGAMLLSLESEQPEEVDPLARGLDEPIEEPLRMTMIDMRALQLRPIMDELREIDTDMPLDVEPSVQPGADFDFRVRLLADGTLEGRVYSIMNRSLVSVEGTRIVIYRDRSPVGSAISDANGDFRIRNMRPGVFGLTATGRAGYAAFSFEIKERAEVVMSNAHGERFTSQLGAEPGAEPGADGQPLEVVLDWVPVVLCPPPLVDEIVEIVDDYYRRDYRDYRSPLATRGQPVGFPAGGAMFGPPGAGAGVGLGGAAGGGAAGGVGIGAGGAALGGVVAGFGGSRSGGGFSFLSGPVSRSMPFVPAESAAPPPLLEGPTTSLPPLPEGPIVIDAPVVPENPESAFD